MELNGSSFVVICLIFMAKFSSVHAVCERPTDKELEQKLTALNSAFPRDMTKIDLVVILDRSKSISNTVYNDSLTALRNLFDYLVKDGRLYLHRNYARMAVLLFGKTVTTEFNGISDDARTFDTCEINQRILSLPNLQDSQEESSQISAALHRAETLFTARRKQNTKQVLWVFFDGAIDEGYVEDRSAIESMAKSGVIIFSAAIGKTKKGWLDTVEEENRVKQLAKDTDHTACVEEWIELLHEAPVTLSAVKTLYSAVSPQEQPSACSTCTSSDSKETCACDVTTISYGCYVCGSSDGCGLDDAESSKHTEKLQWWVIVIYIVAGVIAFFVLASIIVGIACYCRTRDEEGPPPPPIPPIPPRKSRDNQRQLHIMEDDPIYTNNSGVVVNTHGTRLENVRQEEEVELGNYNVVVDTNQCNMEGWDKFLLEEARENNIKHFGIFNLERRSETAAWTPAFKLSKSNLRSLDKMMTQGSVRRKGNIKINDMSFKVDSLSPLNLHAKSMRLGSKDMGSVTQQSDDLHVSKIGNFLIVGVATADRGNLCEQKVCEIRQHLEKEGPANSGYQDIDKDAYGGNDIYENGIHLSNRR